jgi:hypothetical protein
MSQGSQGKHYTLLIAMLSPEEDLEAGEGVLHSSLKNINQAVNLKVTNVLLAEKLANLGDYPKKLWDLLKSVGC